jgi:hypothetical protein
MTRRMTIVGHGDTVNDTDLTPLCQLASMSGTMDVPDVQILDFLRKNLDERRRRQSDYSEGLGLSRLHLTKIETCRIRLRINSSLPLLVRIRIYQDEIIESWLLLLFCMLF